MVALTLLPHRGNHARYFPHAGYLGLSPVVVAGTVKTALREDLMPVDAGKVVVRIRCYEAVGRVALQGGGGGIGASTTSNDDVSDLLPPSDDGDDFDQRSIIEETATNGGLISSTGNVAMLWEAESVLWEAPRVPAPAKGEAQWEWAPLGDWSKEFRLVVPTEALTARTRDSPGALGSMTLKGWRVWWQVEAVVFHRPAGMTGSKIIKSHLLRLSNYSTYSPFAAVPSATPTSSTHSSVPTTPIYPAPVLPTFSHGIHPRLTAMVSCPPVVSSGDSFPVSVTLLPSMGSPSLGSPFPVDQPTVIKKVLVSLERTVALDATHAAPLAEASASSSTSRRKGVKSTLPPSPALDGPSSSAARRCRSASPPVAGHGASEASDPSFASRLADMERARSSSPASAFKSRRIPGASSRPDHAWARRSSFVVPTLAYGNGPDPNLHSLAMSSSLSSAASDASTGPTAVAAASVDPTAVATLQMAEAAGPLGHVGGALDEGPAGATKWTREVLVSVPRPRSAYHYATGETCRTRFGSVTFAVVVKITFKTRSHGTETLEVPALPVEVSAVSKAERGVASEHLNNLLAAVGTPPSSNSQKPAKTVPPVAAPTRTSPSAAASDVDGDVDMAEAVDDKPLLELAAPPAGKTLRRPPSAGNVRRRSEASDAIDAPNRRRPRSAKGAGSGLAKVVPAVKVGQELSGDCFTSGVPDCAVPGTLPRPRPRTQPANGPTAPAQSVGTSAPRRVRGYPHGRPRSSGSHGSPVSFSSRSFVTLRSEQTESSNSNSTVSAGTVNALIPPSSALTTPAPSPMQIDVFAEAPSPVIRPPYPSPPLDDSPAINFGAFTLSPRPRTADTLVPQPDSPAQKAKKKYRGPFDKRGSPVVDASPVLQLPPARLGPSPVLRAPSTRSTASDSLDDDAAAEGGKVNGTKGRLGSELPTPPGSASSSTGSIPLWDKLSTTSAAVTTTSDEGNAVPTAPSPDPSSSSNGGGGSRKGSNKWSAFFRRGSKVVAAAATVK